MTVQTDCWGNDWTAKDAETVRLFETTVLKYLAMRVDVGDSLKAVFVRDPEMPIAHMAKAAFLKMFALSAMDSRAAKSVATARTLLEQGDGGTEQEKQHLIAIDKWVSGDMRGAIAVWQRLLLTCPRDVLASKFAHFNLFYLGDADGMRQTMARLLHAWKDDDPGYGFMLGNYAFTLEETGAYDRAEAAGRKAVEIDPADIWAAHAVAHVCEMQARPEDGAALLDSLSDNWSDIHNFRFHAEWHRALFFVELEDYDGALAYYDNRVWTEESDDYLDVSNGVALLWRLENEGIDVGDRWSALADKAAGRIHDHRLLFADLHYLMALIRTDRMALASEMRDSMAAYTSDAEETQASITDCVGIPVADALFDIAAGRPGRALERLLPVRNSFFMIGGSRAQRDLFDRLTVTAAVAEGRADIARSLIAERLDYRPNQRWSRAILQALDAELA
ncbi:MAG: tetratricopeptide repeat protein [Alphaproteobacteria bacterium]